MNTEDHSEASVILVVDDMVDTREMLRRGLELYGFKVEVAGNGREGLSMLAQHHIDAVLTDLWMPDMNGADFIEAARAQPATVQMPIIMMSASFDRVPPKNVAADAFLAKPFDFPPLLKLLDRFHCHPAR